MTLSRTTTTAAAVTLLLIASLTHSSAPETTVTADDYDRAAKLLRPNLAGKIRNARIMPHWMGDQDRFWYPWDGENGTEYIVANAATGELRRALKHQEVEEALAAVVSDSVLEQGFQIADIQDQNGDFTLIATVGQDKVRCTLADTACSVLPADQIQPGALVSTDGKRAVFSRDHNLWLRDLINGEERQLTTDGAEYYGYGAAAEQERFGLKSQSPLPRPTQGTYWSPDGRWLISTRLDERKVATYPFTEWVQEDGTIRPRNHQVRVPLLGDSHDRIRESFIIDTDTGTQKKISPGTGYSLDNLSASNRALGWSADGRQLYLFAETEGAKSVRLLEADLATAAVRVVLQEREVISGFLPNTHLMKAPNIRILSNSRELVWYSKRDGWGHLYLYNLDSGKLKNRITSGPWAVWDIIQIDEVARQIYFTAGGREAGRDPYYRHLYRASLDSGEIVLLTPENADHEIDGPGSMEISNGFQPSALFSPSNKYFIDSYSTVENPSSFVVRSTDDGRITAKLGQANPSALLATDWRPPKRVAVKAADGKTDIYAAVFFPPDFDPGKKYPVIDAIYGGQITIVAPRTFYGSTSAGFSRVPLAALGFVVVSIDGRGTHFRSKAFQEYGYGSFVDTQLEDHVAAIKQLAERFPFMDTEKVGIYGHSNGGYSAARAILKYPHFYKVAVSSAGSHNYHGLPGTAKSLLGVPDYGEGQSLRPDPTSIPNNYRVMDNASFAGGLRGKLLLVFGDMDTASLPGVTISLIDALVKNNKRFDLLYLPNRSHAFFVEHYFKARLWDYFVEHLMGQEPPLNHTIETRTEEDHHARS